MKARVPAHVDAVPKGWGDAQQTVIDSAAVRKQAAVTTATAVRGDVRHLSLKPSRPMLWRVTSVRVGSKASKAGRLEGGSV